MANTSFLQLSPRAQRLLKTTQDFVEQECIPAEAIYFAQMAPIGSTDRWLVVPPIIEQLKAKAKELGLWNLFLPKIYPEGPGLTNLEYALLCEVLGRSFIAPEATNTAAPDTGNMEVLAKYGNQKQKDKWLKPLMEGKIRSAFCMTEPAVASSDATNIRTAISREGDSYVITGRKWWISGAGDPRCKIYLVMGKHHGSKEEPHRQQSVVLVPADTPGITVVRPLPVFGYDDAPHGHCEILFENVRVPAENMILGEGRGFEIIQGRLGPGRIHHCMRAIGMASRALDYHLNRATDPARKTFGKLLHQHGSAAHELALSRIELEQARLMVLKAADTIDLHGPKKAMVEIAMAKVVVPTMALKVMDRAIQAHGAAGVSNDIPLAYMYASMRTLRIADGPDEVHIRQIAQTELKRAAQVKDQLKHKEERERSLRSRL
ncbi:acyl-CoA dehydrogenase/oxidase [Polychytrium aggregatum]|uniref:acyl-CoA dehydrogenase/oxidase n=1 Tax=Polychytrium aggregatum TaxID=110093 RepID=UPI0022FF1655|nr:acyl-CoA dehydrogenase/oxidase [Polychytrium aggregatum]KAI9205507.1 acyl-CoA dehydrogenase/oxidase [Polychytrium aggregatum]